MSYNNKFFREITTLLFSHCNVWYVIEEGGRRLPPLDPPLRVCSVALVWFHYH